MMVDIEYDSMIQNNFVHNNVDEISILNFLISSFVPAYTQHFVISNSVTFPNWPPQNNEQFPLNYSGPEIIFTKFLLNHLGS
jgi:pantothenate kinase type III